MLERISVTCGWRFLWQCVCGAGVWSLYNHTYLTHVLTAGSTCRREHLQHADGVSSDSVFVGPAFDHYIIAHTLHTYWLPGLHAGENVCDLRMALPLTACSWGRRLIVGWSPYIASVLVDWSQVAIDSSSWSVELPLQSSVLRTLCSSPMASFNCSS